MTFWCKSLPSKVQRVGIAHKAETGSIGFWWSITVTCDAQRIRNPFTRRRNSCLLGSSLPPAVSFTFGFAFGLALGWAFDFALGGAIFASSLSPLLHGPPNPHGISRLQKGKLSVSFYCSPDSYSKWNSGSRLSWSRTITPST